MKKKETQHLLKIKKEDYPQIFDFLEGLPRGTKTAHIREALLRYIADEGENPRIPTKSRKNSVYVRSEQNGDYNVTSKTKESYHNYMKRQQLTNISDSINDTDSNKKDEEFVNINIDDL